MLEVGLKAPNFSLYDQNDNEISLSDFLGQKVVLYFYPKDNTKGCTIQALSYKDLYKEYEKKHIKVIGISKDSIKSHDNFSCKYELPFTLLADVEKEVNKMYDVWKEKKLYGKTYMGTVRSTYIIDEKGMIIFAKEKVKPVENAKEVLEFIENYQN